MFECPICGKKCKRFGLKAHIWRCHTDDGKNFNPDSAKGYRNGTRKGTNQFIKGTATHQSEETKIKCGLTFKGKHHTEESKEKIRKAAIKNNLGGNTSRLNIPYETLSGNIIFLQSSYELIVAKDLDVNGIEWNRPKPLLWIDRSGITRRYYPDFYLPALNVFLDPKNDYLIEVDRDKIQRVSNQNNVRILVLDKNNLNYNCILAGVAKMA